jgi:hypothetical protein
MESLFNEIERHTKNVYRIHCDHKDEESAQSFQNLLRAVDKMRLYMEGDFRSLWLMEQEDAQLWEYRFHTVKRGLDEFREECVTYEQTPIAIQSSPPFSAHVPVRRDSGVLDLGFDEESPIVERPGTVKLDVGFPPARPSSPFDITTLLPSPIRSRGLSV